MKVGVDLQTAKQFAKESCDNSFYGVVYDHEKDYELVVYSRNMFLFKYDMIKIHLDSIIGVLTGPLSNIGHDFISFKNIRHDAKREAIKELINVFKSKDVNSYNRLVEVSDDPKKFVETLMEIGREKYIEEIEKLQSGKVSLGYENEGTLIAVDDTTTHSKLVPSSFAKSLKTNH